jgi:glycosyltransferase involved in cell wall biosynthesis
VTTDARISIIVPVRAKDEEDVQWLRECIESVQAQTIEDWEMVVVSDHSEVSLKTLKPLFKDSRIQGVKATKFGVSNARNQGVVLTTAPLLLPVDADDILPANSLEGFLAAWPKAMKQGESSELGSIVYGDTLIFGVDYSRYFQSAEYEFSRLLRQLIMPVGSLHSRAAWQKVNGWKPEMEDGLEDWEYWITLGEQGVCGLHVREVLYHYRRHGKGRLGAMQKDPSHYQLAYQKMRDLHKDTYDGRLPVGCCGGRSGGGKAANVGRRQPIQADSGPSPMMTEKEALALADTGALSQVRYIGPRIDFFVRGRPSSVHYYVEGPNAVLIIKNHSKHGVLPQDVRHLIGMHRGRDFLVVE